MDKSWNRTGYGIAGTFPSLKMGVPLPYHNTLVRDLHYFLEYDPTVLAYEPRPFAVMRGATGSAPIAYTPDFRVATRNRSGLVDCVAAASLDSAHTQSRLALGRAWADDHDWAYLVVTDRDLHTGHRLANLQLLWRYARARVPLSAVELCTAWLSMHPDGTPLGQLAHYLVMATMQGNPPPASGAPWIYNLLFRHVLWADLAQPLSPDTLVYLATRPTP